MVALLRWSIYVNHHWRLYYWCIFSFRMYFPVSSRSSFFQITICFFGGIPVTRSFPTCSHCFCRYRRSSQSLSPLSFWIPLLQRDTKKFCIERLQIPLSPSQTFPSKHCWYFGGRCIPPIHFPIQHIENIALSANPVLVLLPTQCTPCWYPSVKPPSFRVPSFPNCIKLLLPEPTCDAFWKESSRCFLHHRPPETLRWDNGRFVRLFDPRNRNRCCPAVVGSIIVSSHHHSYLPLSKRIAGSIERKHSFGPPWWW